MRGERSGVPEGYERRPHVRFMAWCGAVGLAILITGLVLGLALPPPFSVPALPHIPELPDLPNLPSGLPKLPDLPGGPR